MKVIIDTNVLLNCIGRKTKHHFIWQLFIQGEIKLFASSEMLMEYEEIIHTKYPENIAKQIMEILYDDDYVHKVAVYFFWEIIKTDPDDNKFLDAAIAANIDYLITNDNHFKEAQRINFPKVNIISPEDFSKIIISR